MTDHETIDLLCHRRVLPVVVLQELDHALPLAGALADGGLPVAEVTFRTAVAADAIRLLTAQTDLLVGAGTVVRPEQVDAAVAAGARFVVTPGLSRTVVERCVALDVPVIPGVVTASDVIAALELGLDVLKLFPAEAAGGVTLLQALHAPFPDVRWVPTGGVGAANAAEYLALDYVAAIGGSWMAAPALVAAGAWDEVSRLTAEAVGLAAAGAGVRP